MSSHGGPANVPTHDEGPGTARVDLRDFSLVEGGPLYCLARRCGAPAGPWGLARLRLSPALITWVPAARADRAPARCGQRGGGALFPELRHARALPRGHSAVLRRGGMVRRPHSVSGAFSRAECDAAYRSDGSGPLSTRMQHDLRAAPRAWPAAFRLTAVVRQHRMPPKPGGRSRHARRVLMCAVAAGSWGCLGPSRVRGVADLCRGDGNPEGCSYSPLSDLKSGPDV